jgi:D-galactarolactone isomerase
MHIVYPTSQWPVLAGETPYPVASVSQYRAMATRLGIERCIMTQTPLYGFDNRCVLAAIAEFGDGARGTAAVGANTPKKELRRLTDAGIRGAALHMLSGNVVEWDEIPSIAENVMSENWHLHIQLDGLELESRLDVLEKLPNILVIDHVGKFSEPADTESAGFKALMQLVERGRCYVKLSAPYESAWGEAPYMAHSGGLATALIKAAPECMIWGTNWPHLGLPDPAQKPDDAMLLDTLLHWTDSDSIRSQILCENPARLYGY